MYALTITDLKVALKAAESSTQTLIDLQIDKGLLRHLLVMSEAREGVEFYISELCAKTQPAPRSDVFDTTPLQVGSLAEKTPCTPDSELISLAQMDLSWLIIQERAKL